MTNKNKGKKVDVHFLDHETELNLRVKTTTYYIQPIEIFSRGEIKNISESDFPENSKAAYKDVKALMMTQQDHNAVSLSQLIDLDEKTIANMKKNKIGFNISFKLRDGKYEHNKEFYGFPELSINDSKIRTKLQKEEIHNPDDPKWEQNIEYTLSYSIPYDQVDHILDAKLNCIKYTNYEFNFERQGKLLLNKPGHVFIIPLGKKGFTHALRLESEKNDYHPLFHMPLENKDTEIYILSPIAPLNFSLKPHETKDKHFGVTPLTSMIDGYTATKISEQEGGKFYFTANIKTIDVDEDSKLLNEHDYVMNPLESQISHQIFISSSRLFDPEEKLGLFWHTMPANETYDENLTDRQSHYISYENINYSEVVSRNLIYPVDHQDHNWVLDIQSQGYDENIRTFIIPANLYEQQITLSTKDWAHKLARYSQSQDKVPLSYTCDQYGEQLKFYPKYKDKGTLTRKQRFHYDPYEEIFSSYDQKQEGLPKAKILNLGQGIKAEIYNYPKILTTYVNITYNNPYNFVGVKGETVALKDVLPEMILKSWKTQFALQQKAVDLYTSLVPRGDYSDKYDGLHSIFGRDPYELKAEHTFGCYQPTTGLMSTVASENKQVAGQVLLKSETGGYKPLESGYMNTFSYHQIEQGAAFQFGNAGRDIIYLGMKNNYWQADSSVRGWRVIFDANNFKAKSGLLAH